MKTSNSNQLLSFDLKDSIDKTLKLGSELQGFLLLGNQKKLQ